MKARIGILLADPTGIGPELVAKLLAPAQDRNQANVVVIGERDVLASGEQSAGVQLPVEVISDIQQPGHPDAIPLIDLQTISMEEIQIGHVSQRAGEAVLNNLTYALDKARAGLLDGLVYAPLNKEAMRLAGSPFEDELRLFANHLAWTKPAGEINVSKGLWSSRATSHVPLSQVSSLVTRDRVLQAIRLVNDTIQSTGVDVPRIALAALNPHGGEGGYFGGEEREAIAPAVEEARSQGIHTCGPFPADTIFVRARREGYDAVVSMYHDQGQIALKLLGFDSGVTINGGLPIPIATPAHGTAHDIAGKGVANPGAMRAAFLLVCQMASRRASLHDGSK